MMLALKHAPPRGFFQRMFHALTAARLVTHYPHSGIVIDGQLLHSNLSQGLHSEAFTPEGWDLFGVPGGDDALAWELFYELEGTPYDWFSLLAFVLPWRVSDSSRLYCFESSWVFATGGQQPRRRVTPEDLLALIARKEK